MMAVLVFKTLPWHMQAYQMLTMLYSHRLVHIAQPVRFNVQAVSTLEHSIFGVAFQCQVFQLPFLPSSLSLTDQRNKGIVLWAMSFIGPPLGGRISGTHPPSSHSGLSLNWERSL